MRWVQPDATKFWAADRTEPVWQEILAKKFLLEYAPMKPRNSIPDFEKDYFFKNKILINTPI